MSGTALLIHQPNLIGRSSMRLVAVNFNSQQSKTLVTAQAEAYRGSSLPKQIERGLASKNAFTSRDSHLFYSAFGE